MEDKHKERCVIPTTPVQKMVSYLLEIWADEWLLIPAMHYRWNKDNFPFIYEEFGAVIAPWAPSFIRAFLGKRVGAKFKGFVPLLGINENSIPAIEDWYENHVLKILNTLLSRQDYVLGSKPSIADFGLMGPLYAHLYRDPASGKIMKLKAPSVVAWIERMNEPKDVEGEYANNDSIDEALLPLIERLFAEFWPTLVSTVDAMDALAEKRKSEGLAKSIEIPRILGKHEFTMGGVVDKRGIGSFHQWKLQRVLDCYQAFDEKDKGKVDEFLKCVGGFDALQMSIKNPVKRVNNKLVFA